VTIDEKLTLKIVVNSRTYYDNWLSILDTIIAILSQ